MGARALDSPAPPHPTVATPTAAATDRFAVLRLSAYKLLVPCFVNVVPLGALLHCWDRMLLRLPPAPASGSAMPAVGRSAAHIQIALALIAAHIDEVVSVMSGRQAEGMGLGFDALLRSALSQSDGPALVTAALEYEISADQLSYLRSRLCDPLPADAEDEESAARRARRASMVPVELSGIESTALRLMACRRSDPLPTRLVKHTLLLASAPPAPILAGLQFYYPKLVSSCALTFCAFCLWGARGAFSLLPRIQSRS